MNKSQDNITFINLQVGLSSIQVAEHNYNTKIHPIQLYILV